MVEFLLKKGKFCMVRISKIEIENVFGFISILERVILGIEYLSDMVYFYFNGRIFYFCVFFY